MSRNLIKPQDAEAMLPAGNTVHTFREIQFERDGKYLTVLMGIDRRKRDIIAAIEQFGCELSGPKATAMNHGLVLFDPKPLFIETKKSLS